MKEFSEASSMFLEHYQLSHDPFADRVPNPQFLQTKRKEVLSHLVHFSRFGNFLLLVTGPSGSGKTMLRHALLANIKDSAVNVVISGQHSQDAAAIMHNLAVGLKAESANVEGLLHAIEQLVVTGSEVHVLVDDAQALDEEAIRLLQHLANGRGDARARVYLFGTAALQTLVEDVEKTNPDASHYLTALEPWNQAELEDYLSSRLQAAGSNLDIFTAQELEQLGKESGGWPGAINQLARDLLMARMFDRPQRRAIPPLPYKYLALLFLIAFLIVAIWYWQGAKPEQPQMVKLPEVIERPMISSQRHSELPAQPVRPVTPEPVYEPEQIVPPVEPEPLAPAPVVAVAPPAPVSPAPEVTPKPEPKPAPKPTVAKPAASVAEKKPVAPTPAPKTQPISWYHAQPAQNFTLQLMATANLDAVKRYAERDPQYHFFRKLHDGKYLYVLTYGSYASREQAQAVVGRLPAELRSNKPWPRTFASVVQEIR